MTGPPVPADNRGGRQLGGRKGEGKERRRDEDAADGMLPLCDFKRARSGVPFDVSISLARWSWLEEWDCCGTVHTASVPAAVSDSPLVAGPPRSDIVSNILCARILNYAEEVEKMAASPVTNAFSQDDENGLIHP